VLSTAAAALLMAACTDRPTPKAPAVSTPSNATAASPVSHTIIAKADTARASYATWDDSSEMALIRASKGVVSRYGDTLVVRLSDGHVLTNVNTPWNGEASNSVSYLGVLRGHAGGPDFHILGYGDSESFSAALIDVGGDEQAFPIPDRPIVSPDGTRFLAHSTGQTVCSYEMGIWRLTTAMPVSEWSSEVLKCDERAPWELVDPVWRSADTIVFGREEHSRQTKKWMRDSRPSFLVHSSSGWTLDSVTAAALVHTAPR
jgi:hypothetical protein